MFIAALSSRLDDVGMEYEAWVSVLYPFMDIPALVLVIVLTNEVADRIASRLMQEYFSDHPGIFSLSEVQIFRSQKF